MNELDRWKKYVSDQLAKYQPWMGPRRQGPFGYLPPDPLPTVAVPDARSGTGGGATSNLPTFQGELMLCVQQLAGGMINWGMTDAQARTILVYRAAKPIAWVGEYDPDCAGSSIDPVTGDAILGPIAAGLIDDVYVPLFRFAVTPQ